MRRVLAALLCGALLAGTGLVGPRLASAATRTTTTVSDSLASVSCPSTRFCMAVGARGANQTLPLTERWTGSRWLVTKLPSKAAGALGDVSCTSSTFCLAVGAWYSDLDMEVLRWNGAEWRTEKLPSPSSAKSEIDAVSCTSSHFCLAIVHSHGSVAEEWNGSDWKIGAKVAVLSGYAISLTALDCLSSSFCEAVGSYAATYCGPPPGYCPDMPFADAWNGTKWRAQIPASPKYSGTGSFFGVSCASVSWCIAVGDQDANTAALTEEDQSGSWTYLQLPAVAPGLVAADYLGSVACITTKLCQAAGNYTTRSGTGFLTRPVVQEWNGSGLKFVRPPAPTGVQYSSLASISCPSPKECLAVGDSSVGSENRQLGERWNGSAWSALSMPTPSA